MKAIINKTNKFEVLTVMDGTYISNVAQKEKPTPSTVIRFDYTPEVENILHTWANDMTPITSIDITNNIGDVIFSLTKTMFCTNVFHFINPSDNYVSATFVEEE